MPQDLENKLNKNLILRGLALFFACFLILCIVPINSIFAQDPDITISSNATWESGTHAYNNILITNGATLTLNGAVTINAQNLTIDSGSFLSANGKGHPATQGPGTGTIGTNGYGGGAGYGGNGSNSYQNYGLGGSGYGSIKQPIELGSGGAASVGGAGGGAIRLNITGTLILNGTISSNGVDGKPYGFYGGGGSGGSIYITTDSLTGNGTIVANGGKGSTGAWNDGPYGGGGGGGRIALYYTSNTFQGLIQAQGGKGDSSKYGGAGTIFTKSSSQRFGDLIVDNNNNPGVITQAQEAEYNFDNLKVLNKASAILPGNITSSNLFIKNNSVLDTGSNNLKVILNLISIESSSKLQGNLAITANNLSIDSTSSLSADAKGYPLNQGPGVGLTGGAPGYGGGAGYGGKGSSAYSNIAGGTTYGSSSQPIDLGSGGGATVGGAGGGAIKLAVLGNLTINGIISSNGQDGKLHGYYGGGGSGGSLYIIANNLIGNGTISANGGKGSTVWTDTDVTGGGGGGGRLAIYYSTSSFSGKTEAKGGVGYQNIAEDGTVVFQGSSEDSPITSFNLAEKSFTASTLSETLSTQPISLNNVTATGDLNGTVSFTDLEIVKIETGSFTGKGFSKGEFEANLEGITYRGSFSGISYFIPSEGKIYLKGELSGDINGICDGYISESIPQSGVYDKYQASWKLNRLGTETVSVTSNLEGTLSYLTPHSFTSGIYLYQANMEGAAFGYYTGPLSAVVTHLRLTDENEYKGQGFSIISYNSSRGQGEAYSYNNLMSEGKVDFSGLSEAPILGRLSALLDEAASPKTLSGTIERMDFGILPQPDLKVKVWSTKGVSPGQKVNYVIEYRNDGLKSATEAIIYNYLDPIVNYISASQDAYYDPYAHQVSWNLGALPAKSVGYLSIQVEIPWGLPAHIPLENSAYILDIILHSTEENGFCNGISFNSGNPNDNEMYKRFKSINNATWFKLYDRTNELTGSLEAYLASKDVVTSRNGVGETSEIIGNRPEWIGYSGGTTTLVNQAKNDRISGDALYLISPQLVTIQDLQAVKSKFGKIVVYQGDDLIPDNMSFKIWIKFGDTIERNEIISYAKGLNPPDTQIENLISKIEEIEGNKTLKYFEVFPKEAGNRVKITWNDGTVTQFNTTNNLQTEEGIEIMILPGIKHEEWIPVLANFKEKYGRFPASNDLELLKNILKKFRENTANHFAHEVVTANDPNDIIVSPEGNVRPGDELTYTINYENIGEGIAFGVYITDILEEDLDDLTLVVNNGGSYDPATRTLNWTIGEVGPGQKGSVSFKVKVRADALDNSEVINFATIYFPSVPQATRTNGAVNKITTIIDNVPPTTIAIPSVLPNPAGWNNGMVTINLTATDNEGGSGVVKTEYSLGEANWVTYVNPFTIINEGTTKVYYKSTDRIGNVEVAKFIEIKIDNTPPEVFVTVPGQEAEYILNEQVIANWQASDNLSGIASITGTALSGSAIDTASIGLKSFNATATDKAGNTIDQSLTYNVRYAYAGVLSPINQDGSSIFKLGRVVPVKFQLKDAVGNYISTAVARIYLNKISNNILGSEIEAESVGSANTGNLFRYDATENQYIFNLGTGNLSKGTWQIKIQLDDGSLKYVTISFK